MKEVEKELEWARWRKSMWTTFYSGSMKDILCIEKLERDAAADEDYITERTRSQKRLTRTRTQRRRRQRRPTGWRRRTSITRTHNHMEQYDYHVEIITTMTVYRRSG